MTGQYEIILVLKAHALNCNKGNLGTAVKAEIDDM